MQDYYQILGIPPGSDFQIIKKAYYQQAKKCHPDRFDGHPAKAEAFKRLVEAFNVLSDPLSRAVFDAHRVARGTMDSRPSINALRQEASILDTHADDILEEMIVGNTIPLNTTLQTLMLDLERTERFCLFREGKNYFYAGQIDKAHKVFEHYLIGAPLNILAQYYSGRCHVLKHRYRAAAKAYAKAIGIAEQRRPPLYCPRIRRELESLRRRKLGPVTRALAWWRNDHTFEEPLAPDLAMRREVSRAMNNLLRDQQRRERLRLQNRN